MTRLRRRVRRPARSRVRPGSYYDDDAGEWIELNIGSVSQLTEFEDEEEGEHREVRRIGFEVPG